MANLRWKVLTVLAVLVVFSGVGVYPLVAAHYGVHSPGWLMEKQLKLGLDLKGGVHLVLRVQTDDALRLETEQEMERLRAELRTKGVETTSLVSPDPTQFRVEGVPPAQDAAFRQIANEVQANFDRGSGTKFVARTRKALDGHDLRFDGHGRSGERGTRCGDRYDQRKAQQAQQRLTHDGKSSPSVSDD